MTIIWILSLLLLLVVAANRYTAAECNLQVEECPAMVKGLEIESLMIPGCCEWPCKLLKNTTASIIIDFRTGKSFHTSISQFLHSTTLLFSRDLLLIL